jgi:hypothetical protein
MDATAAFTYPPPTPGGFRNPATMGTRLLLGCRVARPRACAIHGYGMVVYCGLLQLFLFGHGVILGGMRDCILWCSGALLDMRGDR